MAERTFLVMVALTAAAGPVGLQIYLPCLPAVRETFDASLAATQGTLSLPMLMLAPALLVYGPAADRLGRRPVLLAGLGLFVAGSVGCLLATSLAALAVARVVQTIGGAAGMVLGRAMLSDRYSEAQLTGKIATVTMVTVVLPTVSPLAGGLLVETWGWRSVFVPLCLLALPLVGFALRALPATTGGPAGKVDGSAAGVGPRPDGTLTSAQDRPVFLGLVMQCAFSQAVFMAFVATAPHLMVEDLGRPASEYGLYFVLLAAGFIAGNFSATRLPWDGSALTKARRGSLLAFAGVLLLAALMANGLRSPWALFGPMVLVVFANGVTNPFSQSTALTLARGQAATAAGVISFSQQVAGAGLIQAMAAWGPGRSDAPLAAGLLASALLALLGIHWAARAQS